MTTRSGASPLLVYRILAIAVILAGAIGLAYSKLTFTEDRDKVQVGPIGLTVRTDHTVHVPMWAGIAAIAIGAATLVATSRASRA